MTAYMKLLLFLSVIFSFPTTHAANISKRIRVIEVGAPSIAPGVPGVNIKAYKINGQPVTGRYPITAANGSLTFDKVSTNEPLVLEVMRLGYTKYKTVVQPQVLAADGEVVLPVMQLISTLSYHDYRDVESYSSDIVSELKAALMRSGLSVSQIANLTATQLEWDVRTVLLSLLNIKCLPTDQNKILNSTNLIAGNVQPFIAAIEKTKIEEQLGFSCIGSEDDGKNDGFRKIR
ncbi:MAG: hypothetical protein AB7F59_08795 [Bdellovibrionales bacterium]